MNSFLPTNQRHASRNKCRQSTQSISKLHQIEIVQLVAVAHDIALDLAAVHPSHEILHIPGHQKRRVSNHLSTNPHMTLFDERNRLSIPSQ